MVRAALLITCKAGKYKQVFDEVKSTKGVIRSFGGTGRWDVIAELEAPDLQTLVQSVLEIKGKPGVSATETLIGLEEGG